MCPSFWAPDLPGPGHLPVFLGTSLRIAKSAARFDSGPDVVWGVLSGYGHEETEKRKTRNTCPLPQHSPFMLPCTPVPSPGRVCMLGLGWDCPQQEHGTPALSGLGASQTPEASPGSVLQHPRSVFQHPQINIPAPLRLFFSTLGSVLQHPRWVL